MKTPLPPLAGRLLLLLWAATAGNGCLWPQDVDLPPIPNKRNSPLRLLVNTATPQQVISDLPLGAGCVMPEFKINVEDPDTGNAITSQWYVSPTLQYLADVMRPGRYIAGTSTDKQIRDEPVQPLNLDQIRSLLLQKKDTWQQLEVVATDGTFTGDGLTLVPLREPPESPDQSYLDRYTWFVRVTAAECTQP